MSLTVTYCPNHRREIGESNLYVGLFEFLMVMEWLEDGLMENLNAACCVCAAGSVMTKDVMMKTVQAEARAMQNGGELTTDKLSLKL